MNRVFAFCASCALVLGALSTAPAQPALERLEKEVRQQLDEGSKPAAPAPLASPEKPAAAAAKPVPPEAAPERGYLGAVLDDREDRGRGVRVLRVNPGGPAEKAGVEKGDLITALSGIRVRQLSEAIDIFDQMRPGTEVTLFIRRGDATRTIDVTLGRRPAGVPPPPPTPAVPAGPVSPAPGPTFPSPGVPPAPKAAPGETPAPPMGPPEMGVTPALPPPISDPVARARVEALEREVETLKRETETLKAQVRDLTRVTGALRRAAPPPEPK